MAIGDLKTEEAVKALNDHLATRSYVEGFQPSQADTTTFEALKSTPAGNFTHVLRWYNHIKSYGAEIKRYVASKHAVDADDNVNSTFPGTPSISETVVAASSKPAAKDDDDDVDLFGSDDDDAEADKLRDERLKAYSEKKAKKPGPIAKSSVILDVKPWDDETDMKVMEQNVRSIVSDGLVWGVSKLVPVGYGIQKLQIICVVEDDKVSIDWLQEEIEKFEDVVQSVDVAAFNKI